MLINLTNHPSAQWDAGQTAAANKLYGTVRDLPFPDIDPESDEQHIAALADDYLRQVLSLAATGDVTVHLMGEMTFTVALLKRVQAHHIPCVASTTRRMVDELPGGEKKVKFQFVKFRQYE